MGNGNLNKSENGLDNLIRNILAAENQDMCGIIRKNDYSIFMFFDEGYFVNEMPVEGIQRKIYKHIGECDFCKQLYIQYRNTIGELFPEWAESTCSPPKSVKLN